MLTLDPTDRSRTSAATDIDLPLRRVRVDEYHAMFDEGVLWEGAGLELLDGLLIERRTRLRADDPFVDGEQLPIFRLTLEDYHRLRDSGTLDAHEPCEFIEGLLVETMIRRPPHDTALGLLQDLLNRHLPDGFILRNPSALTLTDSEPEPDLAIVRGCRRDFSECHPGPAQTHLVVEIAESTLAMDRSLKLQAYAKHSIPEYWIVNLVDEQIEVYTDPSGLVADPHYHNCETYVEGQSVPLVLTDAQTAMIAVGDVLP